MQNYLVNYLFISWNVPFEVGWNFIIQAKETRWFINEIEDATEFFKQSYMDQDFHIKKI